MVIFKATILKFASQGEKTGWSYIEVPAEIAQQLKPGNKKSFRVKGKLDDLKIEGMALIPMGEGNFIIALKADIRKKIKKQKGEILHVEIMSDSKQYKILKDLTECLKDEPKALAHFNKLPPSHRNYYSKWIESGKTEQTRAKRIAQTVSACAMQINFGEMMRLHKNER